MKKYLLGFVLAVLMSLSCVLCACEVNPTPDPGPDPGPDDGPSTEVTIESFKEILTLPKTEYLPGEVFDKAGLIIKVNMSDNTEKTIFDVSFTEWTHKDEPLTEDVTEITFTIPNTDPAITFDVPITVGIPAGSFISVDASSLKESYVTTDEIDFTKVTVRYTRDGVVTILDTASDCTFWLEDVQIQSPEAYEFSEEGEYTVTVKYLDLFEATFEVTIKDPAKYITPELIEAEDCAFLLDEEGNETSNRYTSKENDSMAETPTGEGRAKLPTGASGTGAINNLGPTQNGPKVFFKFTVNVPKAGDYQLKMRAQGTSPEKVGGRMYVNLNDQKDTEGKLEFVASASTDTIKKGNQLSDYFDDPTTYTDWFNMYWWTVVTIGTYELQEGDNVIRLRMPNGFYGNIDYFEVTEEAESAPQEAKLYSVRTGNRVDLSKNAVYLTQGKKLEDLRGLGSNANMTPELHPAKYTLIYMQLPTGESIPVCINMISEIDYNKVGEQEVSVTVTKKDGTVMGTAKFKLVIEILAEEW